MKRSALTIALTALVAVAAWAQKPRTQVIAHRGYWTTEGAAQNSRASVGNALNLGIYGCEIDIWLTTDGHLMINHDPTFDGVTLQDSRYKQCKGLKLKNGERMPQLKDALKLLKKSKTPTKLIIEIKTHNSLERNKAAAAATLKAVKRAGLESRVEYIAFSYDVCRELVRLNPQAKVAYLNGEKSPAELKAAGLSGLDYHMNPYREHPNWIGEAHKLGMTVNVWTVDKPEEMREFIKAGVDYITTNEPVKCAEMLR